MNSFRGGMQVHAVPEDQRAFDASGRRLPWGYEYADPELNPRRIPEERGPFGRSTRRRGTSRSRTAAPTSKEDLIKLDNLKATDDIFNSFKAQLKTKEAARNQISSSVVLGSDSVSGLGSLGSQASAASKEPTEVILYGYGPDDLYEVINQYEKISGGIICEDYEREPPAHRMKYNTSLSSIAHSSPRSLSKAARIKAKHYHGGNHWIKVTFDSPEAAERATHYSPRIIFGHLVYAEPYRGVGPNQDAPILAPIESLESRNLSLGSMRPSRRQQSNTLPRSMTTSALPQNQQWSPSQSSDTASSATATNGTNLARSTTQPDLARSSSGTLTSSHTSSDSTVQGNQQVQQRPKDSPQHQQQQRPLRISGATRAVLHPADMALLPIPPWWQRTFGKWPVIGWFVGGGGDIIGNQIPRNEKGEFDWEKANVYWRVCAWLDGWCGTNICGLKED